ncbi:MAG TPA: hypothetical protein VHU22_07960 [Xanthobacteraceae bacterium]|jgi:hypothetical protein|nr:hypothetical protein [Xanthobacteraceae bacterium]
MTRAAQVQRNKPAKAWHARFAAERAWLQLHYCNLFKFWHACRDKRCRRHRRCCGDASECLKRHIGEIPRREQFQARQAILVATPKNAASAEREVRQLMPYDVVTPDPMQSAMVRFKAVPPSSSPVITGEVRRAKHGG